MATILIVDDRSINREFLVTLLSYGKHVLLQAANGKDALQLIHAHQPDLVITDILMPTMNGYELAQALQQDPKFSALPVIFYTSMYCSDQAKLLGDACGVKYILSKPCEPQLILDTVNHALGQTGSMILFEELPKPFNVVDEIFTLGEIDNQVMNCFTDLEGIQKSFSSFIKQTQKLIMDRDELIRISEKYQTSLKHVRTMCNRLVALIDFNLTLLAERDPKKLLTLFCEGLRKIICAHKVVLLVLTSGSKEYQSIIASEIDDKAPLNITNITRPDRIKRLLAAKSIINIDKLDSDAALLADFHANTLLAVSLFNRSELNGFLYVIDKIGGSGFGEIDTQTLSTLVAEFSLLYENIELYDVIQKHATNLQIAVTEREVAKNKIQASETLFRQFAENIDEVFFNLSADLEHVVYISPAYEKMWGTSRNALYREPRLWYDTVLPDDKETVETHFMDMITNKVDSVSFEFRIRTTVGIKTILAKLFKVKDKAGNTTNIIGIASDLTEFNQLKEQAHLNDKLKIIGTLAASVAHETHNPISGVLENLHYIKRNVATLPPDKLVQLLDASIDGAVRIKDSVQNLKGFARVNNDENTTLDLHQVLQSVLTMMKLELNARATLVLELAPTTLSVVGNAGKLHHVFLNLIMNAVQAIPENQAGQNSITIQSMQLDGYVQIDIADTGVGIPNALCEKIFEPFFTTKSVGVGTGLGLSITYDIIKNMRGTLFVSSKVGEGTTFSVILPTTLSG